MKGEKIFLSYCQFLELPALLEVECFALVEIFTVERALQRAALPYDHSAAGKGMLMAHSGLLGCPRKFSQAHFWAWIVYVGTYHQFEHKSF